MDEARKPIVNDRRWQKANSLEDAFSQLFSSDGGSLTNIQQQLFLYNKDLHESSSDDSDTEQSQKKRNRRNNSIVVNLTPDDLSKL